MLKTIPGAVWPWWANDGRRGEGTDAAESTCNIWIYCIWKINMILSQVCNICNPLLDLQVDLRLPNDFPCPRTSGLIPKSRPLHVQNQSYDFTPWSCPLPPTAPPPCSWPSDRSEAPENGPKWFSIPQNMGFDTKIKSLPCSKPKLQFHSLKLSLASYRPTTLFLTFRLIWGSG